MDVKIAGEVNECVRARVVTMIGLRGRLYLTTRLALLFEVLLQRNLIAQAQGDALRLGL